MSALGRSWRFQVRNTTGTTSGACSIDGYRWKPGTSGEADYETSPVSFFTASSIASGAYANGNTYNNDDTGAGFYGLSGLMTMLNGSGTGNFEIYIQQSSDGGTTWPTDGRGELVRTVNCDVASTQVRRSINL